MRYVEKEYFHFRLFNLHFQLRKTVEYFNREKQKYVYRNVFKIYFEKETDTDWIHRDWLNFYTGWNHPCFVYDTYSYDDDNRHHLRVSLGWGVLYLYFPWKTYSVGEVDFNDPEPQYGFYFYGEGKFFDEIVFHLGKERKCIYMPWALDFYKKDVMLKNSVWWTCNEKDIKKARKQGIQTWKDPRFNLDDDDERILKKKYPFTYVAKNGEIQNTTATCHVEIREWRPKWFMWTKAFRFVRRDLEINFNDEMGNRRGSWKGGVLGVSAPITRDEIYAEDFETPLRRYEEKVNRTHDYDV